MRRVVVTGLGIVSSIGNNANEVQASLHDAKSGISFSDSFAEHGFRCQVWGAPTLDPPAMIDRRAHALPVARAAHGTTSPWTRRSRTPALSESDITNERTGIVMGSGGPSTRTIVEAAEIDAQEQQPQAHRPVRGAEGDVVDRIGDACHLVQDPRRQLFDLVRLLHLGALHRQCLRADPVGQAGHDVRRRPRGSRLDDVEPVRRDGRDVVEVQRPRLGRLARL